MPKFADIPIPPKMQGLPRDGRGYPIPVIVQRDKDGKPHFTVNDLNWVMNMLREGRCAICGQRLKNEIWLVGGPNSAFHPRGAYYDGPMHEQCSTYALQVCPYLAMPSYYGRIDDKTIKPGKLPDHVIIDNTMDDRRPVVFVQSRTDELKILINKGQHRIIPKRPWREIRFWQHGVQLSHDVAYKLMKEDAEQRYTGLEVK